MTDHETRRSFLEKVVWLASAAFGAASAIPLVGTVVSPVLRRVRGAHGSFVRVARLDGLRTGEPRKFPVLGDLVDSWTRVPRRRLGAVWLVRGEGDHVSAFSVVCPHLGCGVDFRATDRCFTCPCHGSSFALDGARREGPSPRGMDLLETKVEGGDVLVRYVRFRQGSAEKVQVGG